MSKNIPNIPADASAEEILKAGVEAAGGAVKLACSFSVEDAVIIDIIHRIGLPVGIFALEHVSIGAGFALPFDAKPVEVRFNFSERQRPFSLTVSYDVSHTPGNPLDDVYVRIDGQLDTDPSSPHYGKVTWSFQTLDPATGHTLVLKPAGNGRVYLDAIVTLQ